MRSRKGKERNCLEKTTLGEFFYEIELQRRGVSRTAACAFRVSGGEEKEERSDNIRGLTSRRGNKEVNTQKWLSQQEEVLLTGVGSSGVPGGF